MRRNQALVKQRAGRTTYGPALAYDSADLAEQIGHLGFDWVWLDRQHGQFTERTLNHALAGFLLLDSAPIVPVKGHGPGTINRVLAPGALGVMVPMIQSAKPRRRCTRPSTRPTARARRAACGSS